MKSWPTKKLGDVIDFLKGKKMPVTEEQRLGYEPYIGIDTLRTREYKLFTPEKNGIKCSKDDVLVVWDGAYAGTVGIEVSGFAGSTVAKVVIREPELDSRFLRYFWELNGTKIRNAAQGAAIPHLSKPFINNLKIPLPLLASQKQIVERLDKIAEAQKLNDGLIQKTDELFQSLLHQELNPAGKNWEVKKLSEIGEIITGTTPLTKNREYWDGEFLWATPTDIKENTFMLMDTPKKLSREGYTKTRPVPKNAILVTCIASIGKMAIAGKEMATNQQINSIICNKNSNPFFVFFSLQKDKKKLISLGKTTAVPIINKSEFGRIKIFLPPFETQKQIVAKLSAVQDYKKQLLEQKAKLNELFDSALAKSMAN